MILVMHDYKQIIFKPFTELSICTIKTTSEATVAGGRMGVINLVYFRLGWSMPRCPHALVTKGVLGHSVNHVIHAMNQSVCHRSFPLRDETPSGFCFSMVSWFNVLFSQCATYIISSLQMQPPLLGIGINCRCLLIVINLLIIEYR